MIAEIIAQLAAVAIVYQKLEKASSRRSGAGNICSVRDSCAQDDENTEAWAVLLLTQSGPPHLQCM